MQPLTILFTLCALLLFPVTTLAQAVQQYDVDPSTGLRMERYRAPVPDTNPDATTLDTAAATALHSEGDAIFIDVYPPKGLGPDPLDGHWVITEQRQSIPGSTWLPEVGRGTLQPDAMDYFARNLYRLTEGDKAKPLVFFCTADCWQSWNAARRASELGFSSVNWFPLGSDGWLDNSLALERIYPINFLNDTIDTSADNNDSQ